MTTNKNILVCAQSNAACDEIANRLCAFLNKNQMLRMYSMSFDLKKVSSTIEPYCNLIDGEFKLPSLQEIYKFRVLICTLSTSGFLNGSQMLPKNKYGPTRMNMKIRPNHFDYVFIDECASAHETMSLIPIAGNEHSLFN